MDIYRNSKHTTNIYTLYINIDKYVICKFLYNHKSYYSFKIKITDKNEQKQVIT